MTRNEPLKLGDGTEVKSYPGLGNQNRKLRMLLTFLEKQPPGHWVSLQELAAGVYGYSDPAAHRSIKQAIWRLRHQYTIAGVPPILSIPGGFYRLGYEDEKPASEREDTIQNARAIRSKMVTFILNSKDWVARPDLAIQLFGIDNAYTRNRATDLLKRSVAVPGFQWVFKTDQEYLSKRRNYFGARWSWTHVRLIEEGQDDAEQQY